MDENLVIVDGFSPNDFCDFVCPSFWALWQLLAIESSHAPYFIFAKMELDGVGKLMAKDCLDAAGTASEQLWGNDNLDVSLAGVVLTVGTEGHIATFWEPFGASHDKRYGEVRPNDALDIAVQLSVHSVGVITLHIPYLRPTCLRRSSTFLYSV
ncbi:MAG: hypothetical protein KAJ42_00475 [Gemmatimonadetes bacterium]|nr:hypothetical protein [Gemmatimonadota bacterium]